MSSHFKLALRVEGRMWNAYIAPVVPLGTVEPLDPKVREWVWLGSIAFRVVDEDREMKARFMALMQDTMAFIVKQSTGEDVTWPTPPAPAPANERGSA